MAESFFRRSILRSAWFTLWANPALWFFGLFAAILSVGEEYDLLVRNGDAISNIANRLEAIRKASEFGYVSAFWHNITEAIRINLPGTLTVLVTWIIAILALVWLIFVSQSALIEGARRRVEGKSFGILDGFDVGMANFWRIFLMNVVVKVLFYGSLLIVILPLTIIYVRTGSIGSAVTIALWSFLILFPLTLILSFVTKFAASYIVLRGYRVKQALLSGWGLFRRNWLVSLELAIIITAISFLASYMVVTTLIVTFGFPDMSVTQFVLFLIVFGFIFSWLTVFKFTAWTNLFLALEAGGAPSKLRRIVHEFLGIRESSPKPALARTKK